MDMSHKTFKHKKNSLVQLAQKYASNQMACVCSFIEARWPTGFYCEKCGHQHYLFASIIFQDNNLELYKFILGIYLFFTANKGFSAVEMVSALDINYKTALRLCKKCRILMLESDSQKILDSMFYESDVVYIGAKTEGKTRMATNQHPFFSCSIARQRKQISMLYKINSNASGQKE